MNNIPSKPLVKSFPWKCGECGERQIFSDRFSYSCPLAYDGRVYEVHVPELEAPRCRKCGEVVLTDAATEQISAALRRTVGLLSPEEIRRRRKDLGLSQAKLAQLLEIAETTLCRWETGTQIQQRSLNHLLDLFFTFPQVRSHLGFQMRSGRRSPVKRGKK